MQTATRNKVIAIFTSAVRTVALQCASGPLIGTALAAMLPVPALLIVTVVFQLASGIMYRYAKNICQLS